MIRRFTVLVVIALAAVAIAVPHAQKVAPAAVQLEAANQKATLEADAPGALKLYEQIVATYGKTDPASAATALLKAAELHQKLGDGQARASYDRVIREFGDQPAAKDARARIAGMGNAKTGVTDTSVWAGDDVPEPAFSAIAPTGKFLAYTDFGDEGDLIVRDLTTNKDRRLTDNKVAGKAAVYTNEMAVSRDGKWIAYAAMVPNTVTDKNDYELRVLPPDATPATAPRTIVNMRRDGYLHPYDWSADGRFIAAELRRNDQAQVALVAVASGEITVLKTLDWQGTNRISISPDGKWVAYDRAASDSTTQRDVYVLATDGSREYPALTGPSRDELAGWSPDGKYLVVYSDLRGGRSLWALPIAAGKTTGEPIRLTDVVHGDPLGMTAAGSLVYFTVTREQVLQIGTFDFTTGKMVGTPASPALDPWASNRFPRWSDDGKWLAYFSTQPRSTTDRTLVIQSTQTGVQREVPLALSYVYTYDWAPDASAIVARATDLKGREGVFCIDTTTGAITPIAISTAEAGYFHPEWSADGKSLYYVKGSDAAGKGQKSEPTQALVQRNIQSGEERVLLKQAWIKDSTGNLRKEGLSPDGRYLVAFTVAPESTLYAITVATGDARALWHSTRGNVIGRNGEVQWMPDSKALIVNLTSAATGHERELWFVPLDGAPKKLDLGGITLADASIGIHPDGKHIAFISGEPTKLEFRQLDHFLPAPKR